MGAIRLLGGAAAVILALAAGVSGDQSGTRPPAGELARALQTKYDSVKDFSADFVHVYQGGALRKRVSERGTVLVRKPGRMRWSYKAPEEKLFVSDGEKMYSYIPQDNQVLVTRVPAEDEATTPALFLTGKGNLSRDFTVSYAEAPEAPPGTTVLKLVPKRREPEYEWLMVVTDESLRIRMLITVDAQGGQSTFTFTNLKENRGLSDKEFTFKIPRGADVITEGRPSPRQP